MTIKCYFRLLDKDGLVYTHFLDLVPLDDGKADTVVAAIKRVIQEKGLPTNKLYGLGTDGAAVMTGMKSVLHLMDCVK